MQPSVATCMYKTFKKHKSTFIFLIELGLKAEVKDWIIEGKRNVR
jgi:hypothetical protein